MKEYAIFIYIVLAAFAGYYLFCAIKTNKNIKMTAQMPGRYITIGVTFVIVIGLLLWRFGFSTELLFTALGLALALLVFLSVKSGIGDKGVYQNGRLMKKGDIKYYDYETPYKDYYRVRFNSFSRDIVLYIPKSQGDELEDYLRQLKIFKK